MITAFSNISAVASLDVGSICSRFGNAVVYPSPTCLPRGVGKERGLTKRLPSVDAASAVVVIAEDN